MSAGCNQAPLAPQMGKGQRREFRCEDPGGVATSARWSRDLNAAFQTQGASYSSLVEFEVPRHRVEGYRRSWTRCESRRGIPQGTVLISVNDANIWSVSLPCVYRSAVRRGIGLDEIPPRDQRAFRASDADGNRFRSTASSSYDRGRVPRALSPPASRSSGYLAPGWGSDVVS
jgi:hypothetical protein